MVRKKERERERWCWWQEYTALFISLIIIRFLPHNFSLPLSYDPFASCSSLVVFLFLIRIVYICWSQAAVDGGNKGSRRDVEEDSWAFDDYWTGRCWCDLFFFCFCSSHVMSIIFREMKMMEMIVRLETLLFPLSYFFYIIFLMIIISSTNNRTIVIINLWWFFCSGCTSSSLTQVMTLFSSFASASLCLTGEERRSFISFSFNGSEWMASLFSSSARLGQEKDERDTPPFPAVMPFNPLPLILMDDGTGVPFHWQLFFLFLTSSFFRLMFSLSHSISLSLSFSQTPLRQRNASYYTKEKEWLVPLFWRNQVLCYAPVTEYQDDHDVLDIKWWWGWCFDTDVPRWKWW